MRIRIPLLLLAAVLCLAPAAAQKRTPSPEQVARYRAVRMSRQLELPDKTADAFIPVYEAFQMEMNGIMQQSAAQRNQAVKTDADAEGRILSDFRTSRALLDLRERYYLEFKKILPPLQIRKMYSLEKRNAEHSLERQHED